MTRSLALSVVVGIGALSMVARGYQAPAPQGPKVIEMQKVRDNLYVLLSSSPADRTTFSGGNVAVFITDTGVVLVDTKLAGWGQAVLDKVKTVTAKPVTTIIDTHTHGDHTGNNGFFGSKVEIVAHENTKANMTKMDAFKGEGAKFLPSRTYKDRMSLGSGKDEIDLYYFGAGHTDGDTFVVFPALRVLHAGDMFAWKDAPFCDRNNGGSCVAHSETLAKVISTVKDIDTVIPGHEPVTTWSALQQYRRYSADLLAEAQAAMKAGKTVDEATAIATPRLAERYAGYQAVRVKAAVQAIYDELKK